MNWRDLDNYRLVIYSTSWCSDCRRLKAVLDENAVKYDIVDIDIDMTAAAELRLATGREAIPFVKIGDLGFIRGWHDEAPMRWDEDVFFREAEALIKGV